MTIKELKVIEECCIISWNEAIEAAIAAVPMYHAHENKLSTEQNILRQGFLISRSSTIEALNKLKKTV